MIDGFYLIQNWPKQPRLVGISPPAIVEVRFSRFRLGQIAQFVCWGLNGRPNDVIDAVEYELERFEAAAGPISVDYQY